MFLVWSMSRLLTWRRFMIYTAAGHQGAIQISLIWSLTLGVSCTPSRPPPRSSSDGPPHGWPGYGWRWLPGRRRRDEPSAWTRRGRPDAPRGRPPGSTSGRAPSGCSERFPGRRPPCSRDTDRKWGRTRWRTVKNVGAFTAPDEIREREEDLKSHSSISEMNFVWNFPGVRRASDVRPWNSSLSSVIFTSRRRTISPRYIPLIIFSKLLRETRSQTSIRQKRNFT